MAHVLVIDDSPTELHKVKTILEKDGHQVTTADSGESGITVAKSVSPDVILMDVVMPGMNGFQATRTLTKDEATSSIPVIMLTTKDQATDKLWAKRQGASDYLTKPVKGSDLLKTIKQHIS